MNAATARGRHRATRSRLSLAKRVTAATLLLGTSGFAAATWPTAAEADAPVQTAWWNASPAPDPATPAGGVHVSVASSQIVAYGAVLYAMAAGATGTLELKVSNLTATPVVNPTSPSTDPAANVVACPTKGTWKAGDDQPMSTAPGFDCTRSFQGRLSADQTTLTFLIDSSLETTPGQLSLAIVPVVTDEIPGAGTPAPADTTQPYSLDIAKPDATSLTVTGTAPLPPPPPVPHAGGAAKGATGAATSSTGSTASSAGSVTLPPSLTGTTGTTGASTDAGASPVIAPSTTVPGVAPAAATSSTNNRAHNAALAMLLLIGLGIVAMSGGQMQRSPRLLGGAGRHAARAGDLAVATAGTAAAAPAAAAMPMTPYGNRGLGRFAKPRTEPARPLT
jgi:hypothetical protein